MPLSEMTSYEVADFPGSRIRPTVLPTEVIEHRRDVAPGPRSANISAVDSSTAATTSALPRAAPVRCESNLALAVVA